MKHLCLIVGLKLGQNFHKWGPPYPYNIKILLYYSIFMKYFMKNLYLNVGRELGQNVKKIALGVTPEILLLSDFYEILNETSLFEL